MRTKLSETPLREAFGAGFPPAVIWLTGPPIAIGLGILTAFEPKLGLAAGFGIVLVLLALSGFAVMFAAWSLSFFIPFFSAGNAMLKVGLLLTAMSFILTWALNPSMVRRRASEARLFLLAGVAFMAWITLTVVWAPDAQVAVSQLWKYAISVGVFAAVILAVRDRRDVRLIVWAFVIGALITSLCGLLGFNGSPINPLPGQSRVQGGIGDPNVLAAAVLAGIVLAAGLMAGTRRPMTRLFLLAAIVVFGLTAAGTESRGGAIAAVIVLCAALVVMRGRRAAVLAILVAGLVAAGAWLVVSPGAAERLTNLSDHANGRYELWRIAWEMFLAHPLTGVGLQNFIPSAPAYVLHPGALSFVHLITEKPVVVHNTYLQFLAETGVVGLMLFLTVVAMSLAASLKAALIYESVGESEFAVLCRCVFLAAIALLAAGFFFSAGVDYKLWAILGLGPCVYLMALRAPAHAEATLDHVARAPALQGISSPRVAVVIPCFNDGATLRAALNSVAGQELCEIVVVDDGSDDPGTLRVLDEVEAGGVHVVHQENQGLSAARMRGVAASSAPYIQPLDADDMLTPGALALLADVLDADPGLGMAWGDQEVFGDVAMRQRRASSLDRWEITHMNRLTEGLIRRDALIDVGGWVLKIGYEDWDLYMGLAERGWRGARLDMVTYRYRIASSRMLSTARGHHAQLYSELQDRHPLLFRERRRNWRRSAASIRARLLIPLIAASPASELTRHRLSVFVTEPVLGLRSRLSRWGRGGTAQAPTAELRPETNVEPEVEQVSNPIEVGDAEIVEDHAKSTAYSAFTTLASQAAIAILALANVIVVGRVLGPAGRGSVAFLTTVGFMSSWLSTFGVDQAISNIGARSAHARRALAGNAVFLSVIFGGAAAAIVLGATALFPALQGDATRGLLIVVMLNVPVLVLQIYLRQLAAAQYHFTIGNLSAVVPAAVNIIGNVGLYLLGELSVTSAVLTWLAGQAMGTLWLWWYVHTRLEGFGRPDLGLAAESLRFGIRAHTSHTMNLGNYRADQWIMGILSTPQQLGLYSVAVSWSEALFLVPQALMQVQRPDLARSEHHEAGPRAAQGFRLSVLMTLVLAVLIIAAAPFLCVTVFGEDFQGSIVNLRIIALGGFGIVALKLLGSALTAQDRPLRESFAVATSFVTVLALDFILIPSLGGEGASIASLVGYTVGGVAMVAIFCVTLKVPFRAVVPDRATVREAFALTGVIRRELGAMLKVLRNGD